MKRFITGIIAFTLSLTMLLPGSAIAFAEESSSVTDSSGTVYESGTDSGVLSSSRLTSAKDYYWAGEELNAGAVKIGYDFIAAGRTINVSSGKIGGAARAAAQYINLSNIEIARNTSLAAQSITLTDTSFDSGVFAASDVSIDGGRAQAVNVFASKVFINGRIDGDLYVECENLEFGPKALVTGSVRGESSNEPVMAKSAKLGEIDVTISPDNISGSEDSSNDTGFLDILQSLGMLAFIWLLIRLAGDGILDASTEHLTKRTAGSFALGAAVFLGAPFAMIILMITVIGIPAAFILMMLYAIVIIISIPYAGSVLGRAFCNAKRPDASPWASTAAGALILWIMCRIPFIGWLIRITAIMFTAGTLTHMANAKLKESKAARSVSIPAVQTPVGAAPAEHKTPAGTGGGEDTASAGAGGAEDKASAGADGAEDKASEN